MSIRWWVRSLLRSSRPHWPDANEWLALEGYRGLVSQAFAARPFNPVVATSLWVQGQWQAPDQSLRSPSRRERDNASHHYGHDIQLKRHAGLPLVGRPLPWLLEHGLKVSREAEFERPKPWSRGYLCMGPRRAAWIAERHQRPAIPIGPWIAYARPVLPAETIRELRHELGSTLLVVLAHSWGSVQRHNDCSGAITALQRLCDEQGYQRVIWLRHWQDPQSLPLPPDWLQACNGHRSNPWFLDSMRTLLELCDGLASNSFGTHLGYAVACQRGLHWLEVNSHQDLSSLSTEQQERERNEWSRRQTLGEALKACGDDQQAIRPLLEPFWGFSQVRTPETMARVLRGVLP